MAVFLPKKRQARRTKGRFTQTIKIEILTLKTNDNKIDIPVIPPSINLLGKIKPFKPKQAAKIAKKIKQKLNINSFVFILLIFFIHILMG